MAKPKRIYVDDADFVPTPGGAVPVGDLAAALPPAPQSFDAKAASHPNVPTARPSYVSTPQGPVTTEQAEAQAEVNRFGQTAEGEAWRAERQRQLEKASGGPVVGRIRAVLGAAPIVGGAGPQIAARGDVLAGRLRDFSKSLDLGAAADSAIRGDSYADEVKRRKDAYQAAYDAAAQAYPYTSGVASTAYSLAPGMGASRFASPLALGATHGLLTGADTAMRVKMRADEGDTTANMRALMEGLQAAGPAAAFGAAGPAYVRSAPGRVTRGAAEAVTQGERWAKGSLARKFAERAGGEDLENFADAMAKAPKVERALSIVAPSSPGRAVKAVAGRMDELSPKIAKIEAGIDDAGGISTDGLLARLNARVAAYKAAKEPKMLEAATKVRDKFVETFSDEGHLQPTSTARQVRNFTNDLGSTAFANDPLVAAPLKARAQRELYREFTGAIEESATKHLGAKSAADLADLNRQMSVWYAAKNALKDRAAIPWRPSWATVVQGGGAGSVGTLAALGAGDATTGVALGLAAPVVGKGIAGIMRVSDYYMAKMVKAARSGSKAAGIARIGVEAGLGAPGAGKLAQRLIDNMRGRGEEE